MERSYKNISLLMIFVMLIALLPANAAYGAGPSFKLYSQINNGSNTPYGKVYIYASAPDAKIDNNGGYSTARFFRAGDGIIHEPTQGSLDGFNTTVTVRHKVGYYATFKGKISSRDSDLAAVITYVENGVVKKSPALRFTGFHYTNKQGSEFGSERNEVDLDLGTYPNVVNVNIFHLLSEPLDGSTIGNGIGEGMGAQSAPYHVYVQFDAANPEGPAEVPTKYPVETKVKPYADSGNPSATPKPAPETPVGNATPPPLVQPGNIGNGPAISLGLGSTFSLYSQDQYARLVPAAVNGVVENAAPYMNMNNGTVRLELGGNPNSKASFTDWYGNINSKISYAAGAKAVYTPKEGLLKGVVTKITACQCLWDLNNYAVVKYDGGKEARVDYLPTTFTLDDKIFTRNAFAFIDLGEFLNVESVTVGTYNTKSDANMYMPSLLFKVVNEEPSQPAPDISRRKYVKPDDTSTETPEPVSTLPVQNVNSSVSLNEALSTSSKAKGLLDAEGDNSDWIELYNNSDSVKDLSNYYIADGIKNLKKWKFPSGTKINAHQYLVIFASGKNKVINGEIHTNFSIAKGGENIVLSNGTDEIYSVMSLPVMKDDTVLARIPDGGNSLSIANLTPRASNNSAGVLLHYVLKPEFSNESGFYENPFTLSINGVGGTVHYTTDGSEPTVSSPSVGSGISITNPTSNDNIFSAIKYLDMSVVPSVKVDKCMVVRAATIDAQGNSSEVVTKTYFVGYDMENDFNNTMVLSITTDKENLFNEDYGIFPNYWEQHREFESPIHLDIFNGNGRLVVGQNAGMRVRGFGSKGSAQKGLNIYARAEYGSKYIEYPLFNDSFSKVYDTLIEQYKSVALRTGGVRYSTNRYADGMGQKMIGEATGVGFQSQRPVIAFINGEYWGVYYMAERAEDDYIEAHYGVPTEDVILIKNHLNKGEAVDADRLLYESEKNWLSTTDFSVPANYSKLEAKYDLQDLMSYYAGNIALANRDWIGYNFATWRSRSITDQPYRDGKWRFLTYDMDAMHYDGNVSGAMEQPWGKALSSNPSLKRLFVNQLCDWLNNEYSADNTLSEASYWWNEYYPVFKDKMKNRWGSEMSSIDGRVLDDYGTFSTHAYKMIESNTSENVKIRASFNLKGEYVPLNVRINDNSRGSVKVNGVLKNFSKGSYTTRNFTDYASVLEAVPEQGYEFTGWTCSEGTALSSSTDELTFVTLSNNGSRITANFERVNTETRTISTAADLAEAAQDVNSGAAGADIKYVLINDIALTGTDNFTPIGTVDNPFTGTFDGQSHIIRGLNLASYNIQGRGLFGYVGGSGIVKNAGVEDVSIVSTGTNGKNVGGIAGNNGGIIENCYSMGTLSGVSTVGGIAGNNKGGTVKNCYSTAIINSESENSLGGVAGKTESSGIVSNCYSLINPVGKNEGGTVDLLTGIKTAQQFASGEVAYLLNISGTRSVWGNTAAVPVFANDTNKPVTVKVTFIPADHTELYAYTFSGGTVSLPDSTVNWIYNNATFTASTVVTGSITVVQEDVTPSPSPTPSSPPDAKVKLSGAVIGTAGSYLNGPGTIDKAFDGDTSTYCDNDKAETPWAGLDLGTPRRITAVRYYPRSGYVERMQGGKFQGSNTADFSSGVVDLYTVSAAPVPGWNQAAVSDIGSYRYVRYISPARGFLNVAEVEFYTPAAVAGISEITVASNKVTNVTITGDNKLTGNLIVAVYDDNVLTGIKIVPVSDADYSGGIANITVNLDIPAGSKGVKAMMFNSLEVIQPLVSFLPKDL